MTLTELKAQAARVFAEEERRYEWSCASLDDCALVMREGKYQIAFRGTADACKQYLTLRGLEAVWKYISEHATEVWIPTSGESHGPERNLAFMLGYDVLGAMSKQEG